MQSPPKAARHLADTTPAALLGARTTPDLPLAHMLCVNAVLCRAVLAYAQTQGVSPARLMAPDTGRRLQDACTSVPLADWHALLDAAEAALHDDDVALKAAEHVELWQGGVLGYALMTSPCISAAGELLVRFQRLLTNAYHVQAQVDERRFELRLLPTTDTTSPRLARMLLASWASRMRWFTGQPTLCFNASFESPAPARPDDWQRRFGGVVAFGQPCTALSGSADYLALPVMQRDPQLNGLLCQQAAAEVERLSGSPADLLLRLRRRLRERLGQGELSLEALAADLDIAPRTLQLRLEAQGLTFRALLDGVRERRARQYLADGRLSLTEIALSMGFANQSAFQHAFKRWTGLTPGQWRRQHAGG